MEAGQPVNTRAVRTGGVGGRGGSLGACKGERETWLGSQRVCWGRGTHWSKAPDTLREERTVVRRRNAGVTSVVWWKDLNSATLCFFN